MKFALPRRRRAAIMAAAPLVLACTSTLDPRASSDEPIRTDRELYTVSKTDQEIAVDIPFSYTNRTGETVYVINCRGIAPPSLEKWVDGAWVPAWSPVVPLCLSPPITIEPGETYSDTLHVVAGRPGSTIAPTFQVDGIAGHYRLVWDSLAHEYDQDRPGFGEPLPLDERISNVFRLE